MPTYEYRCASCDHLFEEFQSMTARPLRKCPACGRSTLRRLIGAGAGIIFKGSGFYETDYRSESYKKQAKAEKDAASGSSKSKDDSAKSSAGDSTNKQEKGSSTKKPKKKD